MNEHNSYGRDPARDGLLSRYEAAEAFAALVVPDSEQVRKDLWSQLNSPGEFAKKHPTWYKTQWGFAPGDDFDWWGIDRYAWPDVQACLGLASYAVLVPAESPPAEVARTIAQLTPVDGLRRSGLLQVPPPGTDTLVAALKSIAQHVELNSDWTLIQLRDATWDGGYVISAVKKADLPELSRLALEADLFGLGILDLGCAADH
jgi:hypothetical protein